MKRNSITNRSFEAPSSLDPQDWDEFRRQAHRLLDDVVDHLQFCRKDPVWQPMPDSVRESFRTPLPSTPCELSQVFNDFQSSIRPYAVGNVHPGFMGWVQGGGSPIGMLAEMLAGGLNANVGGRDQSPLEVEKEVIGWMRELFHFPAESQGLFVTGSSIANFIGILVARNAALNMHVRQSGLGVHPQLTAYASCASHRCISQAMDMSGIGSRWLRRIPVDRAQRIQIEELRSAIDRDLSNNLHPFCVIGCAGTVDSGAIDDLVSLRAVADEFGLPLHIDGAFGALGKLSSKVAPQLAGIELADSLAFDFHKWAQVPYDAGFLLVRNGQSQLESFSNEAAYLGRDEVGISSHSPWPCDLGPDLSRGFRALKTWMTFRVYGATGIARVIDNTCRLAQRLAAKIELLPELELLAPVSLNIVCFRYCCRNADEINSQIVRDIQTRGLSAPSSTCIDGRTAIRVAIFNHRTTDDDVDNLLQQVIDRGKELAASDYQSAAA